MLQLLSQACCNKFLHCASLERLKGSCSLCVYPDCPKKLSFISCFALAIVHPLTHYKIGWSIQTSIVLKGGWQLTKFSMVQICTPGQEISGSLTKNLMHAHTLNLNLCACVDSRWSTNLKIPLELLGFCASNCKKKYLCLHRNSHKHT